MTWLLSATCKFPLVDEWKSAADNNEVLGVIDCILSGYAQIVLCDNPFTGLLFFIATLINSVPMAISSLVASLSATLFARFLGVPKIPLRIGVYNFSPALSGFGIALFIFPGQGIVLPMILLDIVCAVLCVLLSSALSSFFSKWNAIAFSLPFCLTLLLIIPASLSFTNLPVVPTTVPYLNAYADAAIAGSGSWTVAEFFTAFMNNFAEIIFQADTLTGALVFLGILISSRIDVVSAITASCAATLIAIGLGLPKGAIMAGLYGFNAIFIMMTFFGRGFAMSIRSFIYGLFAACLSVFFYVGLGALLAPLGAPVAAFPFAIIGICALIGRDAFTGLRFVEPLYWGVPETIDAMLKEKDAEAAQNTTSEGDVGVEG